MRYIDKRFLSDCHDETGSMVCKVVCSASVEEMTAWEAINGVVEATVEIRDCHGKPAWLEFSIDSSHSLSERLDKVDLMIDMLKKFKERLTVAKADSLTTAEQWKLLHPDEKDTLDEIFR